MAVEPTYLDLQGSGEADGVGTLVAATVDFPEQIRMRQHCLWTGFGASAFTSCAPVIVTTDRTISYPVLLAPGTALAVVQVFCAGRGSMEISFDAFAAVQRLVSTSVVVGPDGDVNEFASIGVTRASALQTRASADYAWTRADLKLNCFPDSEIKILAVYVAPVFDATPNVAVVIS